MYIQHDICGYVPVAGDLAYPDKLLLTVDLNRDKDKSQSDSDSVFGASGAEVSTHPHDTDHHLFFTKQYVNDYAHNSLPVEGNFHKV